MVHNIYYLPCLVTLDMYLLPQEWGELKLVDITNKSRDKLSMIVENDVEGTFLVHLKLDVIHNTIAKSVLIFVFIF
jgi:hypothetical protein